ncbi:MAG: hypothetical protein QM775_28245 [Pirellulales bacterium]
MEDPVRLTALATQVSSVNQSTALIAAELMELKKETSILRLRVHSLRSGIQAVQWIAFVSLLILVGALGGSVYFGKQFAKDVIREVVQAETSSQTIVTQHGYLSTRTKKLDNPLTFEWALKQPISPHRVVSMIAEPSAFMPGMTIEAKCVKDGKACQIIVLGNTSKFRNSWRTVFNASSPQQLKLSDSSPWSLRPFSDGVCVMFRSLRMVDGNSMSQLLCWPLEYCSQSWVH